MHAAQTKRVLKPQEEACLKLGEKLGASVKWTTGPFSTPFRLSFQAATHAVVLLVDPEQAQGPVSRGDSQPQPPPLVSWEGWDKFVSCQGWPCNADLGHAGGARCIAWPRSSAPGRLLTTLVHNRAHGITYNPEAITTAGRRPSPNDPKA